MDDRVVQLKRLKKECKKAKRKHVAVWKTFGILFLLLAIIFSAATPVALLLDNAVVAVAGGAFWEVLQPDENAEYFTVDYTSDQERLNAGKELSYQLEAEGAVLLQNSGVLPFAQGTKIRTQSASDALKADLAKSGLTVVSAGEKADAVLLMLGSAMELTQEETLLFAPTAWVQIQLRVVTKEGKVMASKIEKKWPKECLDEEVLE